MILNAIAISAGASGGGGGREPIVETIAITENGTYTPNEGVDGFNEVNVNVPIPTFTTEELSATANGEYTPTTDGYSKVTVAVPTPEPNLQSKSVEIVENGTHTISADEGYDGLSNVEVSTNAILPKLDMTKTKLAWLDGGYVDLRMLDMSNVTSLYEFARAMEPTFTGLDIRGWDTSKVTDMYIFLGGCTGLKEIKGIEDINTSNVTNMYSAFSYTMLPSFDLSKWNVGKVTNLSEMFIGCYKTTSINLSGWNTSKVKTVNSMFKNCSELTDVNLSGWNMSAVTDITNMFYNVNLVNLNMDGAILPKMNIPDLGFWYTISVESTISILNALPQLDEGESYTITIHPVMFVKLTDEQKAIATSKGWRIIN